MMVMCLSFQHTDPVQVTGQIDVKFNMSFHCSQSIICNFTFYLVLPPGQNSYLHVHKINQMLMLMLMLMLKGKRLNHPTICPLVGGICRTKFDQIIRMNMLFVIIVCYLAVAHTHTFILSHWDLVLIRQQFGQTCLAWLSNTLLCVWIVWTVSKLWERITEVSLSLSLSHTHTVMCI